MGGERRVVERLPSLQYDEGAGPFPPLGVRAADDGCTVLEMSASAAHRDAEGAVRRSALLELFDRAGAHAAQTVSDR